MCFIILIFLLGSSRINEDNREEYDIKGIGVYFCPKDNCEKVLLDFINSSKNYIYCAFYELELYKVMKLLGEKSKKVDVRIVLDDKNKNGLIKGNVRYDDDKQLMHNKFCIIDDRAVFTGSFNPTYNDNYRNDNNVLIIYSKDLARNYKDEFMELWSGVFGSGNKTKNFIIRDRGIKVESYFCPEDNCEDKLIRIVSCANKSVYFMTFSFTSEKVADAILFLDRNITIKGIFESRNTGKYSQYKRLKDFGIDVRKDKNKGMMHHKVFIIDEKIVVTGSYNPTRIYG